MPLQAIHARFWPAITLRQSPPSLLPRLQALAASECGLWLGARDPEARQHHWKGHTATLALVSTRLVAASVAVTALVLITVWITDLSFQRAILLAPVLVVGLAAVAGLLVFWSRVGWESLRRARHPRLLVAGAGGVLLLLVGLTLLGGNLPRE